jgi:hypothetical protein
MWLDICILVRSELSKHLKTYLASLVLDLYNDYFMGSALKKAGYLVEGLTKLSVVAVE